jgi:hypothetical protein
VKYVRKFFLFIASSILVSSLVATATFWTLNGTIGNRDTIKAWFEDSGVYSNFIDEVVSATSNPSENENPENKQNAENQDSKVDEEGAEASIDADTLANAASVAFPEDFLKTSLESAIDSGYDWLEGNTEGLELQIDFTDAKNRFATALEAEAVTKAEVLPICESNITGQEIDVFSANCLPADLDVKTIAAEFKNEILNSEDLLPDPVIDAEDIKIESDGVEKPFDEAFNQAPRIFEIAISLAWVATVVAVAASLAVVFLAASKRKGLFHLAKSLALATFSVAIFAVISINAPLDFGGVSGGDEASQGFSENIVVPFIKEAISSIANWSLVFAGIYFSILVVLLLGLFLTRKKENKDENRSNHTDQEKIQPKTEPNADEKPEQADKEAAQKPDQRKIVSDIKPPHPQAKEMTNSNSKDSL